MMRFSTNCSICGAEIFRSIVRTNQKCYDCKVKRNKDYDKKYRERKGLFNYKINKVSL